MLRFIFSNTTNIISRCARFSNSFLDEYAQLRLKIRKTYLERTKVHRSMKSRRRYGAFYRRKGQLTIRPSERKGIRSSTASSETLPGENPPRGALVRHTGRGRKDPSGLSKIAQGATPHFLIFNRPLLLRASFLDVLLSIYPRENAPTLARN